MPKLSDLTLPISEILTTFLDVYRRKTFFFDESSLFVAKSTTKVNLGLSSTIGAC
ncbi:hypothetical protein LRP49_19535 [Enterovibrio sp. ZSDZ35]|uniref:Uncharacterized protein n=1 Tax=Enterovibrio qingdaonensis TaxID=2899818 RepID=A0ABT5QQV7_9GAMM|nr:hypothetical protein [Enterovibrio sp. ZSDZ35]MDD1783367.1 hypothetical protein [Enterovibrio sp. ZSDZ35]